MNKQTIFIGLLIVVGLLGLMVWGRNNQSTTFTHSEQPQTEKNGSLTAEEQSYDFGTISMKDGLVSHLFKITNSTDTDIEIIKLYTSCMCTNAYLESSTGEKGPFGMAGMGSSALSQVIKPGEAVEIKAVYDPNAHGPAGVGAIDRIIEVVEANGGIIRFGIKAVVTP